MKQMILLMLIAFNILLLAQDNNDTQEPDDEFIRSVKFNLQFDVLQTLTFGDSSGIKDYMLGNTISLGLEYQTKYKSVLYFGLGALYQFPNSLDFSKGQLGSVPVYGFINYPLIERGEYPLSLAARFGYAFLTTADGIESTENSFYHSFGIMAQISKTIIVKIMYSNNYGKLKIDGNDYRMKKNYLSLVLTVGQ